ncbi:MAG: hypothetical protein ACRDP7_45895 [Trebonia sp.]
MTLNSCPAWCADTYPADDLCHSHTSPVVAVPAGRAKSEVARLLLPSILVFALLPDYPNDAPPRVTVIATGESRATVRMQPPHAGDLAGLIDALAAATPAQHREVAAAIRQVAALTSGEVA